MRAKASPLTAVTWAAALCLAATSAGAATRPVPQGFMGVNAAGPVFDGHSKLADELALMAHSKAESIRFAMPWGDMQPYASFADVPESDQRHYDDEGGVPTDFSLADRVVTQAAKRKLAMTVVILKAPEWAAQHPGSDHSQPKPSAYPALARFAKVLVRRYGTNGSFWDSHRNVRKRPIRNWEAYNEVNLAFYWDQPYAKSYVAMLAKVAPAVRAADKHARVVLSSLTNKSWTALQSLYDAGARRYFDVAALNPYSKKPSGVVHIVELGRETMTKNKDAKKPILVTEMSWTSAQGKVTNDYGWETTEAGQADLLRKGYEQFAAARCRLGIESVFWETWMTFDRKDYTFDYAGLREASPQGAEPRSKPALAAYADTAAKLEQRGDNRTERARCG